MGSGIYHTLNIGSEALFANKQGVDTASHNIANAQVPGFSRQRVNIAARDPVFVRGVLIGHGTHVESVTRSHNEFIEKQLVRSNQQSANLRSRLESLKGIESIFSPEVSASVSDELTNFFNSVQDLSAAPEDIPLRTTMKEVGRNLSGAFRRIDSSLKQARQDINDRIFQETREVNEMMENIAKLNVEILTTESAPGANANDLRDKRDLIVRNLSEKIDVNYYTDNHGSLCVRGPNESTLVDRGSASQIVLQTNTNNGGMYDVFLTSLGSQHKVNITRKNEGGSLCGLLQIRDEALPELINRNDLMAYSFADQVNAIHGQGFGIGAFHETAGRRFFRQLDQVQGAAEMIDLSDDIAQSSDAISFAKAPFSPGDNTLGNELLALKDQKILSDGRASFHDYYANYIGQLGIEVNRADHLYQAQELIAEDLNAQREAISGVSLDEEALNLIRWQTAFAASSKVITTCDEMLETVLSLKR